MTIKSNWAIAISTLGDWLRNLAPIFQLVRSKTENQSHLELATFPALRSKPLLISRNSDWCIALFASVVIGCSNYFVLVFHLKTALSFINNWCLIDMHGKWERSNLEKYVQFDKKKWRYSDQDKDGLLNRQEYEYFHHPKEHEVMLTYVAVVSICGTFSNEQLKS